MQIKNYIVDNRELFFDYLEKELCQNGISYVRIDNEIHFQNKIIRLYDIKLDKRSIINFMFSKINIEERRVLNSIKELQCAKRLGYEDIEIIINMQQSYENRPLIESLDTKHTKNIFYKPEDISNDINQYNSEKSYHPMNKTMQKQQANRVNQKLKMYQK